MFCLPGYRISRVEKVSIPDGRNSIGSCWRSPPHSGQSVGFGALALSVQERQGCRLPGHQIYLGNPMGYGGRSARANEKQVAPISPLLAG